MQGHTQDLQIGVSDTMHIQAKILTMPTNIVQLYMPILVCYECGLALVVLLAVVAMAD